MIRVSAFLVPAEGNLRPVPWDMESRGPFRNERRLTTRWQSRLVTEPHQNHVRTEATAAVSKRKLSSSDITKLKRSAMLSASSTMVARGNFYARRLNNQQQYEQIVKEMELRKEHTFNEKDRRTLSLLNHSWSAVSGRTPSYLDIAGHLDLRYLWLRLNPVRPGSAIVDDDDCWSVIRRCQHECQLILKAHLNVLAHATVKEEVQMSYFTQGCFDADMRRIPRASTEILADFFTENQLKTALYLRNLSKVIEVLENVVDSCMSIPKLRPFLLPLAQTRAIHQLSTFREYMQGADILPLEVNSFNDFIRKKVVTRDQEFSPYMASLICSSAFMLQVTISTLHAIPESISPEIDHQCLVLGLTVGKFKVLFRSVANADILLHPDVENEFHMLLDALHSKTKTPGIEQVQRAVFKNAMLVFSGKEHRSFLDARQAASPVSVHRVNENITCKCSALDKRYCRNCLLKQHYLWLVALDELRELINVHERALTAIHRSLDEFAPVAFTACRQQPSRTLTAALTALLALCDLIAQGTQLRLCRLVLSAIESSFVFFRGDGETLTTTMPQKFEGIWHMTTFITMQRHNTASDVVIELMYEQQKAITKIYAQYATDIGRQIKYFNGLSTEFRKQSIMFERIVWNLSLEEPGGLQEQIVEIMARLS